MYHAFKMKTLLAFLTFGVTSVATADEWVRFLRRPANPRAFEESVTISGTGGTTGQKIMVGFEEVGIQVLGSEGDGPPPTTLPPYSFVFHLFTYGEKYYLASKMIPLGESSVTFMVYGSKALQSEGRSAQEGWYWGTPDNQRRKHIKFVQWEHYNLPELDLGQLNF
jgi:hypothetical protein